MFDIANAEVTVVTAAPRKKSPRAPSMALEEAIDKACKIYDRERCHAAPVEGVAQHMGYKSAANGAALSALASLKYYGLLERPREGMVAVSKDVESFRFAPSEMIKRGLITKWLKSPPVFADLLEKYTETLPSDATLKFELIQRGFAPAAADQCLQVFRRSVDYANYFEQPQPDPEAIGTSEGKSANLENDAVLPTAESQTPTYPQPLPAIPTTPSDDVDRIPIRLAGGRRAWIEIPTPFYEADKERLKRQIDLLLTDDEEQANDL